MPQAKKRVVEKGSRRAFFWFAEPSPKDSGKRMGQQNGVGMTTGTYEVLT